VFSRSPSTADIGYALASPGVLQRIKRAEALAPTTVVGTGGCISR